MSGDYVYLWDGHVLLDNGLVVTCADYCCEALVLGCACEHCSGTTPAIMQVRFHGVVAGGHACGGGVCTDWNDTWFSVSQGNSADQIVPCEYYLASGPPCLGTIHITRVENAVDVTVVEGAFGITQYFRKNYGNTHPIDCWNIGNIPLDTAGGDYYCDWSAATCELRGKTTGGTPCAACSGITPEMIPLTLAGVTDGTESDAALLNASWRLMQTAACTWELTNDAACGLPSAVTGIEMVTGVDGGLAWAEITIFTTSGEATFTYDAATASFNCSSVSFELGGVSDTCYHWSAATCHTGCDVLTPVGPTAGGSSPARSPLPCADLKR